MCLTAVNITFKRQTGKLYPIKLNVLLAQKGRLTYYTMTFLKCPTLIKIGTLFNIFV